MHKRRAAPVGAALLCGLLLSACAVRPVLAPDTAAIELAETPFFAQLEYQCGPAALATVLTASGVATTPEQLVEQVFLPGREGSLQVEMLAAARRNGRVPLRIDDAAGLSAALAAGQPVLVLQNLGLDLLPTWHYAVVVGLDPARDEVILRSGREPRQVLRARRFLDSWRRARYWGFAVSDPQRPPPFATAPGWLESAAALERAGQMAAMLEALAAATVRWPQQALAWQALGNGRYAAGERREAAVAYRRALELEPLPETYNNLAVVLGEMGCVQEAQKMLDAGLGRPAAAGWRPQLLQTRSELAAAPSGPCRQ